MVEKYSFGVDPIPYHAWNKSRDDIAVTPNNQEIQIYRHDKSRKEWVVTDNLNHHDRKVTGIDWAPNTNRIVTCSEDRDAYVWTPGPTGKWEPTQVLLRINRAATCVKWSPLENKFVAGSGAKLISVCYFEQANNWWVSKHIKKPLKSTVTSIDWHPNNMLLAAGSTDFKIKVFSAFVKEIEDENVASPWGNKASLGTLVMEFSNSTNNGGWVHSVAFSSDGNRLCWVAHDSSISVADVSQGGPAVVRKLKTNHLPFLSCVWVGRNEIVAAGHGCYPVIYALDGAQLKELKVLGSSERRESCGLSAMKKFQGLDRRAATDNDATLDTPHQNSVTCVRVHTANFSEVSKISTTGLDGQLIIWNLNQ